MDVSEVGEFGLIARVQRIIDRRQPSAVSPSASPAGAAHRLLLGIGDDCAVWQAGGVIQLATTDTMVQDVHFSPRTISWRDVGWKALAVNLSDIAAMGGIPDYALVTLGLPPVAQVEDMDELNEGLVDCACEFGTALAGGDIVSAPLVFITVSLMGRAGGPMLFPNNVLLRSAAAPGDAIAVTGHPGSSAAGLRLLNSGKTVAGSTLALVAHSRPQPRLPEGRLALEAGIRCGMDVSDGLLADLGKICAASGVAAEIDVDRVPVQDGVRQAFPEEWLSLALSGGEDYELLLAGPAEVLVAVAERTAVPVTVIGSIREGVPGQVSLRDGSGRPVAFPSSGGWDHLARRGE